MEYSLIGVAMKPADVKYKAKIKGQKKLIDVYCIDWHGDRKSFTITDINNNDYIFNDVEQLLPYTGFKDKKGNEIYEGDKLKDGGIQYPSYYIVVHEYGELRLKSIGDWKPNRRFDLINAVGKTIVGNVYEED